MWHNKHHSIGIAGGALFFMITAIAQPFFSLYAQALGASTAVIGLLVTGRALLPMFIAMPVGQLIDVVGALTMARIGFFLLVVSVAMTAASESLAVLAAGQMVLGASIIITASSLQVLVSRGAESARNRNINRYSMAMSAGGMIGPIGGGALVAAAGGGLAGYRFTFVATTALSLAAAIVLQFVVGRRMAEGAEGGDRAAGGRAKGETMAAVRRAVRPSEVLHSYSSGWKLTKNRGVQFGLAGTFLIMFIQVLSMSFVPLLLHSHGYGAWVISAMISLSGLSGIVSRLFLDRFIRRLGLERLLIFAGVVAAASLIAIPAAAASVVVFGLLTMLSGSAAGMNLPVSIMIMVNDTAESERGKVMGLRLLVNRISQMLSPALFGVLGGTIGLAGAFYSGGALLLACVVGFGAVTMARSPKRELTEGAPAVDSGRQG
jgi:predicted MFS family arabinose efflux permease